MRFVPNFAPNFLKIETASSEGSFSLIITKFSQNLPLMVHSQGNKIPKYESLLKSVNILMKNLLLPEGQKGQCERCTGL
jgi:hypothetical protein